MTDFLIETKLKQTHTVERTIDIFRTRAPRALWCSSHASQWWEKIALCLPHCPPHEPNTKTTGTNHLLTFLLLIKNEIFSGDDIQLRCFIRELFEIIFEITEEDKDFCLLQTHHHKNRKTEQYHLIIKKSFCKGYKIKWRSTNAPFLGYEPEDNIIQWKKLEEMIIELSTLLKHFNTYEKKHQRITSLQKNNKKEWTAHKIPFVIKWIKSRLKSEYTNFKCPNWSTCHTAS